MNFPNDSNVLMDFVGVVPFYQITDVHLEPQTHLEKDNVCHDSALTLDHMFDRASGIIEDPPDGRLPSTEDEITDCH